MRPEVSMVVKVCMLIWVFTPCNIGYITLKIEAVDSSEMLVNASNITWHKNPKINTSTFANFTVMD
jgi:hypothetical protein